MMKKMKKKVNKTFQNINNKKMILLINKTKKISNVYKIILEIIFVKQEIKKNSRL